MSERVHEDAGKALGVDGPGCAQMQALGRSWAFGSPTQADKEEFGQWCKQQVLASLRDLRDGLEPGEYRELLAAVTADFATGIYRWTAVPADGVTKLLQSEPGILKLAEICLRQRQPFIGPEVVRQLLEESPEQLGAALRECLTVPPSASRGGSPGTATAART